MARELRLEIAADSEAARKHVLEMAAGVEVLAKEANHLGDEFRKASRDATELDAKLVQTKAAAAALAVEFSKTNDAGVKKQLEVQRTAARDLEKLRKDVVGSTERDAQKATQAWEKAFADLEKARKTLTPGAGASISAGEGFSQLGGASGYALPAGIALGAQPALAAAGGLAGVAAGAGIAGVGVAGAVLGDPAEFSAAWKSATSIAKADFIDATRVFVGPGLDAVRSIGTTIKSWDLKDLFASAAGYVTPLVRGAEQMAGFIVAGLGNLSRNAGPEIATIAHDLPEIGYAIDKAFTLIGDDATGGAEGMHALLQAIEAVIVGGGLAIKWAEDFANGVTTATNAVKGFFDGIPGWVSVAIPPLALYKKLFDEFTPDTLQAAEGSAAFGEALQGVATGADGAVGKMDDLGVVGGTTFITLDQQVRDVAAQLARMNTEFDKAVSDALSLSNADIGVAQAFDDLTKGFRRGADQLDINTQKGRDNEKLINSTIAGLQQQRDATIALGGGTQAAYDKANAAYAGGIARLEQMLIKLGLSKQAADALLDAFRDKTFTITENVKIKVTQTGPVSAEGVISSGVPLRGLYASGTRSAVGGLSLVGEEGPELVDLPPGAGVHTAGDTRRILSSYGSGALGGGGGGGASLSYSGPTAGLDGLFASWLAEMTRTGRIEIHSAAIV